MSLIWLTPRNFVACVLSDHPLQYLPRPQHLPGHLLPSRLLGLLLQLPPHRPHCWTLVHKMYKSDLRFHFVILSWGLGVMPMKHCVDSSIMLFFWLDKSNVYHIIISNFGLLLYSKVFTVSLKRHFPFWICSHFFLQFGLERFPTKSKVRCWKIGSKYAGNIVRVEKACNQLWLLLQAIQQNSSLPKISKQFKLSKLQKLLKIKNSWNSWNS